MTAPSGLVATDVTGSVVSLSWSNAQPYWDQPGTLLGALAAGATAGALPGATLALLRNLCGTAGLGLLSAVALGRAFGWVGSVAYLLATHVTLNRPPNHGMGLGGPHAPRPQRDTVRRRGLRRGRRGHVAFRRPQRGRPRGPGVRTAGPGSVAGTA